MVDVNQNKTLNILIKQHYYIRLGDELIWYNKTICIYINICILYIYIRGLRNAIVINIVNWKYHIGDGYVCMHTCILRCVNVHCKLIMHIPGTCCDFLFGYKRIVVFFILCMAIEWYIIILWEVFKVGFDCVGRFDGSACGFEKKFLGTKTYI